MSDFMSWLHANYIQPQIDAVEKDEYEVDFEIVREDLLPASRRSVERVLTFTAVQAFLLGFRTSEGLTPLPPRLEASPLAPMGRERSARGAG